MLDATRDGGDGQSTASGAHRAALPVSRFRKNMGQLAECWTTEAVKINWYIVIQDILANNERPRKIRNVDSPLFEHCGEPDKFQHREPACGEGVSVWLWTKRRIAWILRIDTAHIPPDWTTRPQFRLLPPRRHRAVLCILAQMVSYRIKKSRACTEVR
jgi:hypothetical protein